MNKSSPLKNMYKSLCHRNKQQCLSQKTWTAELERKQGTFKNWNDNLMMHSEAGVDKSHRDHCQVLVSRIPTISYNPKQCEATKKFWEVAEIICVEGRETLK